MRETNQQWQNLTYEQVHWPESRIISLGGGLSSLSALFWFICGFPPLASSNVPKLSISNQIPKIPPEIQHFLRFNL